MYNYICHFLGAHAVREPLEYAAADNETTLNIHSLVQIDGYSCGAVAGTMVVRTFYPEVKFRDFYKAVNPYPDGVGTTQLINTLRKFNIGCRKIRLTFREIRKVIDDGCPVIVNIMSVHEEDHWAVVYGYKEDPKQVFISPDPGVVRKRMSWAKFKHKTRQVDGIGIVCWGYE